MRSDYYKRSSLDYVLQALTYENRLVLLTCLATGLRLDDVLHLQTEQLKKDRFTIKERKTGKTRRIYIPKQLKQDLFAQAGRYFVFEGRIDPKQPRTRQAVWKDLKRAKDALRVKRINLTPHSTRKIYAVEKYHECGDIKKVQKLLNHSNEAVTYLYALADELTEKRTAGRNSEKRKTIA